MKNLSRHRVAGASAVLLLCLVYLRSSADTFTWDGGAGDGVWGSGTSEANWDTDSYNPGNSSRNDYVFTVAAYAGVTGITLGGTNNPNIGNFTINANAPNLTITIDDAGTGTARFDLSPASSGDETLTILAGSHVIAGINGGEVQLQSQDSQVWNIATGASLEVSATIGGSSGSRGITKTGDGTLVLSGANTYTGGTTLNSGTLRMSADNVLADTGPLTLNGGTLNANNRTDTIGALSLTTDSSLDLLADSNAGVLTFASATWTGGKLTITGWTGTEGNSGDDDQIFFTAAPDQDFLDHIEFDGFAMGAELIGGNELVPTVPEPINLALGVFGFVLVGTAVVRRFLRRKKT